MLILTRKVGESVLIGDDISISVLSVRGNQVKLGVQAPKEVSVHREEIYQRILQSKDEHIDGASYTNEFYECFTFYL